MSGWHAAGRCASGSCIEVRADRTRVFVRDSKLGETSPVITVTPAGWAAFLAAVKGGELTPQAET